MRLNTLQRYTWGETIREKVSTGIAIRLNEKKYQNQKPGVNYSS
jgi:hypothetical protein